MYLSLDHVDSILRAEFLHHSVRNFLAVDDIARHNAKVLQMYPLLMVHLMLQLFAKLLENNLVLFFDKLVVEFFVKIRGRRLPHSNFFSSADPMYVPDLRVSELRPTKPLAHFRRGLLRWRTHARFYARRRLDLHRACRTVVVLCSS